MIAGSARLSITMPGTFVAVPRGEAGWAEGITGLSSDAAVEMQAHLIGTVEPEASAFVVVSPGTASVGAISWIRASPAEPDAAALLTEVAGSDRWEHPSSFATTATLHQLGERLVLTVHLMQGLEPGEGEAFEPQLVERCSSTMYDAQRQLAVRLELTAFDLRLFPDIVATSLEILESVEVTA